MKYPDDFIGKVICGDCLKVMKKIPDNSIDMVCTDPPYGYSFMGKDWDKVVIGVDVWRECLRVLKAGAFAFVMSAPRQDVLSRMIVNLQDAGFETGFTSIYWTYASGFPKASNIGKMVDKRLGAERKKIKIKGLKKTGNTYAKYGGYEQDKKYSDIPITAKAKALDGSYGGFQPKPAIEVILCVMKPLSEKTYVEQAMKNGKGITWLDDGRIPCNEKLGRLGGWNPEGYVYASEKGERKSEEYYNSGDKFNARFPANLLCSDDVLNDGKIMGGGKDREGFPGGKTFGGGDMKADKGKWYGDIGSFSRYFDLDKWWAERIKQLSPNLQKTFPFAIIPKASKGERNKGCDKLPTKQKWLKGGGGTGISDRENRKAKNIHPTCKPIKLMSYLITLGSRDKDVILDPFLGSGTTAVSCLLTNRQFIGIDKNGEYCKIAEARLKAEKDQLKMF
jgi:site-specific DNA-methyltransferase (adenine-specific)